MKKQLINEAVNYEYEIVKQKYDPNKPDQIMIKGVYAQAEKKNGNGRVYPYEVLKTAVDKFIETKVNTKSALEELEHPSHIEISPDRVCARTLSLVEDNKNWIGTSVVLASDPKFGIKGTPCGDLLKSLLQYDCAIGHSTRGTGSVDESTGAVEEYNLEFIDTVCSPSIGIYNSSNASRFTDGILESKAFLVDNHGMILEAKINGFEKKISKLPNTFDSNKKAAYLGEALTEFFNSLTKI